MGQEVISQEFPTAEDFQLWLLRNQKLFARPRLVLLSGPMGVGKTQMVRWLLGDVTPVASPTFAIHHQYQTPQGEVDHFDLYRLETAADLESTGFWDIVSDPDRLVFVEWADRLDGADWPQNVNCLLGRLDFAGPASQARRFSYQLLNLSGLG